MSGRGASKVRERAAPQAENKPQRHNSLSAPLDSSFRWNDDCGGWCDSKPLAKPLKAGVIVGLLGQSIRHDFREMGDANWAARSLSGASQVQNTSRVVCD